MRSSNWTSHQVTIICMLQPNAKTKKINLWSAHYDQRFSQASHLSPAEKNVLFLLECGGAGLEFPGFCKEQKTVDGHRKTFTPPTLPKVGNIGLQFKAVHG